jgi:hypothetical protein
MSGFLSFHRLAAARGDGLHPKLRELLEQREAIAASQDVVEIERFRDGSFTQAGSAPAPKAPGFLPGNVVGFTAAQHTPAAARKKSSASRS